MQTGNAAPDLQGMGPGMEIGGEAFNLRLLEAIRVLQARYIARHELREIFNQLILEVLALTSSEYAFVGEVLKAEDGHLFLKIHDISHIARDEATRRFFEAHAPAGAEFHNLNNLFGWSILKQRPIVVNAPKQDPRYGGRQPHGHPPMHNFLGLPIMAQDQVIGQVGLANRPGGYPEELVEALEPVISACATILQAHRDARSRQLAEESQRATTNRFMALVEKSSDAIAILDGEGRYLYAGPSTLAVIGHPAESLIGSSLFPLVHPEDLPSVRETWETLASGTRRETRFEFRMRHPDGTFRWLESYATNRMGDPAVGGIVCNFRDISERRVALAALEESEARFRSLSESVPVILWTTTPEGEIEYINRYWFDYSGLPLDWKDSQEWLVALHPADWEEFMKAWKDAVSQGRPFMHEFRIRRSSDNAYRWHLARALPVRGSEGQIVKWLGTSVDIHDQKEFTELVRVKDQLDRQTRLLETVLETMGDGLIVADEAEKYLVFNREAKRILSLTPEQIEANREEISRQIRLFREDGKTPLSDEEAPMKRALRGEDVRDEVFLMEGPQYPGGLWLNVSSHSLPWEEGKVAVAVFQDISLRKRAEETLAKQARASRLRSEIQSILVNSGSLPTVLEQALSVLTGSLQAAFAHIWLATPEGNSVELKAYTGTFPMPDGRFVIPAGTGKVGQVLKTRRPVLTNQLTLDSGSLYLEWVRANGIVAFAGFPLLSGTDLVGVLSVFSRHPMTTEDTDTLESLAYLFAQGIQRRQAQEDLQSRTHELEALNKELEAFSYSVSHDLRAPLRSLDGFSRALEESLVDKLDDAGRAHLRRIRGASERMGILIDALLDLSRLNRAELLREVVDLSGLAAQVVRELRQAQPDRPVEIRIQAGLTAVADRRQMERLLTNLLGNAWKFTGQAAEPAIEFGAARQGERTVFHVRDNGAGFDMAFYDKLFGSFQRLHGQNEFPGTGIGLALSYRIIKRHQGDIWAESAPGKGATFYFTLAGS